MSKLEINNVSNSGIRTDFRDFSRGELIEFASSLGHKYTYQMRKADLVNLVIDGAMTFHNQKVCEMIKFIEYNDITKVENSLRMSRKIPGNYKKVIRFEPYTKNNFTYRFRSTDLGRDELFLDFDAKSKRYTKVIVHDEHCTTVITLKNAGSEER